MECPGGREGSNYGVVVARGVDGNTNEADSVMRAAAGIEEQPWHGGGTEEHPWHSLECQEVTAALVEWLPERCAGREVRSRRWRRRRGLHQTLARVRDEVSVSYRYRWAGCWTLEWAANLN